jgi:hypothetical protein
MGVGGQLYTSAAYPQRLFAVIMNSRVDLVSWASLSQVDTSPEIIPQLGNIPRNVTLTVA